MLPHDLGRSTATSAVRPPRYRAPPPAAPVIVQPVAGLLSSPRRPSTHASGQTPVIRPPAMPAAHCPIDFMKSLCRTRSRVIRRCEQMRIFLSEARRPAMSPSRTGPAPCSADATGGCCRASVLRGRVPRSRATMSLEAATSSCRLGYRKRGWPVLTPPCRPARSCPGLTVPPSASRLALHP